MRRRRLSLAMAAFLAAGTLLAGAGAARAAGPAAPATSAAPGTVTVRVDTGGPAIGYFGQHYIGLSAESGMLLTRAPQLKDTGNLARLLANLGRGVLRFGGDSADGSFAGTAPATLRGLAGLMRAAGWSVIYTENLGHFSAARVQADARAVAAALGGRLLAFACGNEPDQYVPAGLRPPFWTSADYLAEVRACYRAIRSAVPRAPLAGPDADYHRTLLVSYARRNAGTVGWFTAHYYPMGCGGGHGTAAARAAALISAATAAAEAARFARYAAIAAIARRPLVMSETSNACHNGIPGVSDSFAAALWAIDYLLTGAEHGVHALNVTTGLSAVCTTYTVLCLDGHNEYSAQPAYYGLLLTRMLGTGRLLPVKISQRPSQHVTAFALRPGGGGLRVMVENMAGTAASVTLRVGGYRGRASADRLRAPSLLAKSGVTIQGSQVARDGTLAPRLPDVIGCTARGCRLPMPRYSAALVTIPLHG